MDKIVDKSEAESKSEAKLKPAEKPVSLRPLKFEEAVAGLLRVKPSGAKSESTSRRESDNG